MKSPESRAVGTFQYNRAKIASKILKKEVHFGILRPALSPSAAPLSTLYFFHGGNGDDRQAVDAGLISLIQGSILKPFLDRKMQIVCPFIGTSFLHEHPSDKTKSYSDFFFNELISIAEKGTETASKSRYLTGLSMGGHAALNAFLRKPDLFAGVGANFPTLIEFDYTDSGAVDNYTARTGIKKDFLEILLSEFRNEFVNRKDALTHDPIELARSINPTILSGKKIYVDVGSKDEFGVFEGGEKFHSVLSSRGITHHFETVNNGKHDADFLIRQFPKMLAHLLS